MGNYLWRGSSNQKYFSPSGKYQPIIEDLYLEKSVGLDIKVEHKEMFFYGVPTSKNEIGIISNTFNMNGIRTIG